MLWLAKQQECLNSACILNATFESFKCLQKMQSSKEVMVNLTTKINSLVPAP